MVSTLVFRSCALIRHHPGNRTWTHQHGAQDSNPNNEVRDAFRCVCDCVVVKVSLQRRGLTREGNSVAHAAIPLIVHLPAFAKPAGSQNHPALFSCNYTLVASAQVPVDNRLHLNTDLRCSEEEGPSRIRRNIVSKD